MGHLDLIETK